MYSAYLAEKACIVNWSNTATIISPKHYITLNQCTSKEVRK